MPGRTLISTVYHQPQEGIVAAARTTHSVSLTLLNCWMYSGPYSAFLITVSSWGMESVSMLGIVRTLLRGGEARAAKYPEVGAVACGFLVPDLTIGLHSSECDHIIKEN